MSDAYIDYFEIDEYGSYFCQQAKSLVGVYEGVNTEVVIKDVQQTIDAVNAELSRSGLTRSTLRGQQGSTEGAVAESRTLLSRFFSFLGSLEGPLDLEAFFPGKLLGNLSQLKGDDLRARLKQTLRGFEVATNQGSELAPWKNRIELSLRSLTEALDSKGQQRNDAGTATAALQKARQKFLEAYNGVAKPIIRGLLHRLDRAAEYKSFFKDLQVNESSRKTDEPPAPTEPAA